MTADGLYIEVSEDNAGQYRWRAKAGNHEVVAVGESYTTRHDAERSARSLFPDAPIHDHP